MLSFVLFLPSLVVVSIVYTNAFRVVQLIETLRSGPLLEESQAGSRCLGGGPCLRSFGAAAPPRLFFCTSYGSLRYVINSGIFL